MLPDPPESSAVPISAETYYLQRGLKLVAASIIIVGLYFGKEILVPFALAVLISFVLDPLVQGLRRWHLPRVLAVVIVMTFASLALAALALFAGRQIIQLGADLPTYQTTIQHKLRDLRGVLTRRSALDEASRVIDAVEDELNATWRAIEQRTGSRQRAPMRVEVAEDASSPLRALHDVLSPIGAPLATLGLLIVFLIFILLERNDLRDHFLRLAGGDLYRTTDAVNEAGQRVSRYLRMQFLINVGYGVPMAIGLWLIGVPGALLWGFLATLLRFVPYLGPVVAGAFPIMMAFAVDPGWDMLALTVALVLGLELISNNLIEPWLYGSSTGLSATSVLLSASFWTVLWGVSGLILATPLTVCLVVMGRHLPALRFLDVLLGNAPVFDAPTRLYQRLIAGKTEEAIELAEEEIRTRSLQAFYGETGVPAMRLATQQGAELGAQHRHRFYSGMGTLLRHAWRNQAVSPSVPVAPQVLVAGVRGEADALAADMLLHCLLLGGMPATDCPPSAIAADEIEHLALEGIHVVCLCAFNPTPQAHVRYLCRQLKRLKPALEIVAFLPSVAQETLAAMRDELGANALVATLGEASSQVQSRLATADPGAAPPPQPPSRAVAPADDSTMRAAIAAAARRAAEVFDAHLVLVTLDDHAGVMWRFGQDEVRCAAWTDTGLAAYFVAQPATQAVPDISHHTELAANPTLQGERIRFCACTPLRDAEARAIGALCILDPRPRAFPQQDVALLEASANELMQALQGAAQSREDLARIFGRLVAGGPLLGPLQPELQSQGH